MPLGSRRRWRSTEIRRCTISTCRRLPRNFSANAVCLTSDRAENRTARTAAFGPSPTRPGAVEPRSGTILWQKHGVHMKRVILAAIALAVAVPVLGADRVKTANGTVEGTTEPSGVHV